MISLDGGGLTCIDQTHTCLQHCALYTGGKLFHVQYIFILYNKQSKCSDCSFTYYKNIHLIYVLLKW
jgi:hypothetical protein